MYMTSYPDRDVSGYSSRQLPVFLLHPLLSLCCYLSTEFINPLIPAFLSKFTASNWDPKSKLVNNCYVMFHGRYKYYYISN